MFHSTRLFQSMFFFAQKLSESTGKKWSHVPWRWSRCHSFDCALSGGLCDVLARKAGTSANSFQSIFCGDGETHKRGEFTLLTDGIFWGKWLVTKGYWWDIFWWLIWFLADPSANHHFVFLERLNQLKQRWQPVNICSNLPGTVLDLGSKPRLKQHSKELKSEIYAFLGCRCQKSIASTWMADLFEVSELWVVEDPVITDQPGQQNWKVIDFPRKPRCFWWISSTPWPRCSCFHGVKVPTELGHNLEDENSIDRARECLTGR